MCRAHVSDGRKDVLTCLWVFMSILVRFSFREEFSVIRIETRKLRRKFTLRHDGRMEGWNKQKDRLRQPGNYLVLLEC